MKKIVLALAAAVAVVSLARGQDTEPSSDLGGVGKFLSSVALSARGGTAVDLGTHVSGVLYVPYPRITSADKKTEYACLGLGVDLGAGVEGSKIKGSPLILPMINPPAIIGRWLGTASHLDFPVIGSVALGVGLRPLPIQGSGGKFVIGNQVVGVLTFKL